MAKDSLTTPEYLDALASFRNELRRVQAEFGDDPEVMVAITTEFVAALETAMANRLKQPYFRSMMDTAWLDATAADFVSAKSIAILRLTKRDTIVLAEGKMGALTLRERDTSVWLESENHALLMACIGTPHRTYSRNDPNALSYSVFLTAEAKKITKKTVRFGKTDSATARSAESARKSLHRLIAEFFKVKLEDQTGTDNTKKQRRAARSAG